MSNCLQEPPNNIAAYMKYLDKEMTIIAALTGATGGVFLYLVKEILKVDQTLAVQPVVPFLVVGLAALGVATLLSYLQRSYMIWCYGQITLAQCGRSDLERAR